MTTLLAEEPQYTHNVVEHPRAERSLIQLDRISKSYRSGRGELQALDTVSLRIEEGEFVAVLGPSGCGKSTLLAVLGLLEKHDEGEYLLAGTRVADLGFSRSADVRNRHIGLVFQAFNLVSGLTLLDNVLLPLRYSRTVPKSEHRARAMAALERVGLADRVRDYPHHLSGGQQQRVAIARAVVTDPSLILADEPTGNLDSARAAEVMDLFEDFHADGATIVMVTHDRSLAGRAGRCVRMHDGKIAEDHHVA
jgi:putative ABC transport system ATP-binding protein